jgi:predicted phosphodiesterase
MSKNIIGHIVKEYLTRFPKTPALTLAKKIYKENPEAFTNVEHARSMVRMYTGQKGDKNRKCIKDTQFYRPAGSYNPFKVPESDCDDWAPVRIPDRYSKGLIFSDVHFPYHDVQATNVMINHVLKNKKIDFILINGDGLDCYQLSRFNKDPRNRSLSDEIWGWIEYLRVFQKVFPGVKIYWKHGNHCERVENYLRVKAPELLDMEEFKLGNIIKLRGLTDIEVIDNQKIVHVGRLPIIHGHEFSVKGSNPVNPARGLFLKTLSSAVVSHHHRTSAHSEMDIKEKLMSWWSIGCLCGLHPEYARLNRWNHGFSYIEFKALEFSFENYKIYQDKVYRG